MRNLTTRGDFAAAQYGDAVGVEQQAVKHVDHDDVEDCVGGQNGLCHGNAKEARVGIHGHEVVESALVRLDAQNPRNDKAKQDEQGIEGRTQRDGSEQVRVGRRQIPRKDGSHDQCGIAHVHHDGR